MRTSKTLPTDMYDLSPARNTNDSMFDFEDLEAKRPSEESGHDAMEFRGEDAQERVRIAELKIVQETVRKIEGGDDMTATANAQEENSATLKMRHLPMPASHHTYPPTSGGS